MNFKWMTVLFLFLGFWSQGFAWQAVESGSPYPSQMPEVQPLPRPVQFTKESSLYAVYAGKNDGGAPVLIRVSPQAGCSNTPVTISTQRHYFEIWDNTASGGSASSTHSSGSGVYQYQGSGGSATAIATPYSAYANAESSQGSGRGRYNYSDSSYYRDWWTNRQRGQRNENTGDQITFFPCREVPQ